MALRGVGQAGESGEVVIPPKTMTLGEALSRRIENEKPEEPLTDAELLGMVMGSNEKSLDAAKSLLNKYEDDLTRIAELPARALQNSTAVSRRQGCLAAAAFELARRWAALVSTRHDKIKGAVDVANFLRPYALGLQQEKLWVLCLDTKNVITRWKDLMTGTLNASLIHPREIYRYAIEHSAAFIILAHNHPSGDPTPSPEDISVTRRIAQAGKLLDIPLHDHVIVTDKEGKNGYCSLKEEGHIR